jgi:hypothetical protein
MQHTYRLYYIYFNNTNKAQAKKPQAKSTSEKHKRKAQAKKSSPLLQGARN